MADEIQLIYKTGQASVISKVYYDNAGTFAQRGSNVAMVEEPASSGLYTGDHSTITAGDLIVCYDSAGNIIGEGAYDIGSLSEITSDIADVDTVVDAILADTGTDGVVMSQTMRDQLISDIQEHSRGSRYS